MTIKQDRKIDQTLESALNKQLEVELFTGNLFLQMSAWCHQQGFDGFADFFGDHAEEELLHSRRLLSYMACSSTPIEIGAVKAPIHSYDSIFAVCQTAYEHEVSVSQHVNHLVDTAHNCKDFSSVHFLQWYVEDQMKTEVQFKSLLDRLRLAENSQSAEILYLMNKELRKHS